MLHIFRLLEAALQLHPRRQGLFELVQGGVDAGGQLGDVGPVLLLDGDEHGARAVEAGQVRGLGLGPVHLGHVLDADHLAAHRPHRRLADGVQVAEGAAGLDVETAVARMHRADGRFGAGGGQGVSHGGGRQLQSGQPGQIQGHLNLGRRRAPVLGLPHARRPRQPLAQALSHLFQAAHGQVLADQGHLHHGHLGGARPLHLQKGDAIGQGRAQGVHLAHHLVILPVGVDAPVELHLDHGRAVLAGGADFAHIVETVEGVLQRVGDQLLHLRGLGAGQDGADDHDRDGEMRVLRPRDAGKGVEPQHGQKGEGDQGELPAADREAGGIEVHCAASWAFWA